jgi:hypothetical protein
MNQSILVLIISIALTFAPSAQAVNCIRSAFSDNYRDLIHQVAVIDENGRRTEEEYAREKGRPLISVQNRFAATGELKCGPTTLTAQLTGANNVITTAAHALVDSKTCRKKSNPENCTFTVKVGDSVQVSKVTRLAGIGTQCPELPQAYEDWAVMKIDPPIRDVNPYDLPTSADITEGESVTAVSAGARDFTRVNPRTARREIVKSIEDCNVKVVTSFNVPAVFDSNCDAAQGNSGGSLLRSNGGRDVLIGITTGSHETQQQIDQAVRTGKPNTGRYSPGSWATVHVPLNDEFLRVVRSAAGSQSI